jgi:hypothetical protein
MCVCTAKGNAQRRDQACLRAAEIAWLVAAHLAKGRTVRDPVVV